MKTRVPLPHLKVTREKVERERVEAPPGHTIGDSVTSHHLKAAILAPALVMNLPIEGGTPHQEAAIHDLTITIAVRGGEPGADLIHVHEANVSDHLLRKGRTGEVIILTVDTTAQPHTTETEDTRQILKSVDLKAATLPGAKPGIGPVHDIGTKGTLHQEVDHILGTESTMVDVIADHAHLSETSIIDPRIRVGDPRNILEVDALTFDRETLGSRNHHVTVSRLNQLMMVLMLRMDFCTTYPQTKVTRKTVHL